MFASKTTKEIQVGEHTVSIVKLSAIRLEAAQFARMRELAPLVANLPPGGRDLPEDEGSRKRARYGSYDPQLVLRHGVKTIDGKKPLDSDLEDLDQSSSELIREAILDLTLESPEERKKG